MKSEENARAKLRQFQPLKMDPQLVDDLLTHEMDKLSFKDRNDIYEEIHGVASLARDRIQHFDIFMMAVANALVQLSSGCLSGPRRFLGTERMALLAERMCESTALREHTVDCMFIDDEPC